MQLFYQPERDKDFFEVCEQIRLEYKHSLSVESIAEKAVLREAQSFYLTIKQYVEIIQKMRCSKDISALSESKQDMYNKVFSEYKRLKNEHPDLCVTQIAKLIDELPAPRFYISNSRATNIYYSQLHAVSNRSKFLDKFFRIQ